MNKHQRFCYAYRYLLGKNIIKSQKELAEKMGASESNVSVAIKTGRDKVLTDSFIMRFCDAFPGIFSLDWLLTGQGEMLLSSEPKTWPSDNRQYSMQEYEAMMSAKDETIAALKREIQAKDDLIDTLKEQLRDLRYQFRNILITAPSEGLTSEGTYKKEKL